jgi:hypothetical protein
MEAAMTRFSKLSLSLAFTLLSVTPSLSQKLQSNSPAKAQTATRNRIHVTYDHAKGLTTEWLLFQPIPDIEYRALSNLDSPYAFRDSSLFVQAAFSFDGGKPTKPVEQVSLIFKSSTNSNQQKLLGISEVIVLVDGQRFTLGGAQRELDKMLSSVNEYLYVSIPYDQFIKVANGKDVRMLLGAKELQVRRADLAALRELAARMTP